MMRDNSMIGQIYYIDNRQYFIGTNAITIIGKGPL